MKNIFAALFSLFYFINLFYQITCNGSNINNNECFNMDEFKNQEMKVVDKPMYRFGNMDKKYLFVAVGNEPFIFWLKFNIDNNNDGVVEINVKSRSLIVPQSVEVNFEIFGRSDCQNNSHGIDTISFKRECFDCPRYDGIYVPVKVWTLDGPVALFDITQDDTKLDFYLPENVFEAFNASWCEAVGFLIPRFNNSDYTKLRSITPNLNNVFKKDGEIEYLSLVEPYTVVWVESSDLFPEQNLIIELEDGQTLENNDVTFEFEANGQYPVILSNDTIPNGLNLKIKKEFCIPPRYGFAGFVRYIFGTNVSNKIKITFNDTNGNNLKLKYWPGERDGKPLNHGPYNMLKIDIITGTVISATTTFANCTSTLAPTTSNILTSSATTTVSSNNPNQKISKPESASEESEGMSLSILIPIIVGSLLGLLIIICIIVICILRCYRSYQRKKYHSLHLETRTQAEEAIRKKRSIWKNIIIALIGPDPNPKNGLRQEILTSPKSIPESTQHRPNSNPTTPRSNSITPAPPLPTPNESKPQTSLVPSVPTPLAPPPPKSPALRLQRTQSIPKSSQSQTFSTTLRAAKKAKRDPRFPDLIPGTIEFIVAKQQCDNGSFDFDGKKSGPRDESDIIQFLNPN